MLVGKGIVKSFGKLQILHGIDIEVHPGKITAIVGPSGSGKSTLLRILSLLDAADSGTVSIDGVAYGVPQRGPAPSPPWPALTVVFQQLFLWPHLTLRTNVELPLRGASGSSELVESLVEEFDLARLMDRYPNEVSLGQRQRAALIRAIALRPKYLLLDEITSALDIEHVSRVLSCLSRVQKEGTGILLVTHLIGFAQRSADNVVFIENGSVLESGGPSILVSPSNERLRQFLSLVETAS